MSDAIQRYMRYPFWFLVAISLAIRVFRAITPLAVWDGSSPWPLLSAMRSRHALLNIRVSQYYHPTGKLRTLNLFRVLVILTITKRRLANRFSYCCLLHLCHAVKYATPTTSYPWGIWVAHPRLPIRTPHVKKVKFHSISKRLYTPTQKFSQNFKNQKIRSTHSID